LHRERKRDIERERERREDREYEMEKDKYLQSLPNEFLNQWNYAPQRELEFMDKPEI
jgi:hypothetical protein